MRTYSVLIGLFFVTFTINAQQADCHCEQTFQWVKTTFESNDAGFATVLKEKGTTAYTYHNTTFEPQIKAAKSKEECAEVIQKWLRFFRKGHISFSQLSSGSNSVSEAERFAPVNQVEHLVVDLEASKLALSQKKTLDFEGIWNVDNYEILIQKKGTDYKGILLNSPNAQWKPGEVKFIIREEKGQWVADFYMRNKSKVKAEVLTISSKRVLIRGSLMRRTFPEVVPTTTADDDAELIWSGDFSFKKITKDMAYLRIPSFDDSNKKAIDSLLDTHAKTLRTTPKLIIDLRYNGGGSDMCYEKLLPLIYTQPIRTVGVAFLSTPLNNQRMLELAQNTNFSEDRRKVFQEYYHQLNKQLNEFVNLSATTVEINSYPSCPKIKEVAIIVNGDCGSTTEQFLLAARQSKKVKIYGTKTFGSLDVSNMHFVNSPCGDYELGYCLSRSFRVPDMALDNQGILPDFYIDSSVPRFEWVEFVKNAMLQN